MTFGILKDIRFQLKSRVGISKPEFPLLWANLKRKIRPRNNLAYVDRYNRHSHSSFPLALHLDASSFSLQEAHDSPLTPPPSPCSATGHVFYRLFEDKSRLVSS